MSTENNTPLGLLGPDLAASIVVDDGCWRWTGPVDQSGYGKSGYEMAHRVTYKTAAGPIPDGYVIDHLCRNHSCVNPDHLEPVTPRENYERGVIFRKALAEAVRRATTPVHTWANSGFKYPGSVECDCGFRPLSADQMIAHDVNTREAVSA